MRRILATVVILTGFTSAESGAVDDQYHSVAEKVVQIQRADYEGNRAPLKQFYDGLAPFLENKSIASRVRYWRGFALWRRALNGFNSSVDPKELQQDLELAASEFKAAAVIDPYFVDAKVGEGSCLSNLMYLNRANQARLEELIPQARQALNEAQAQAPDNPRLTWVQGPNLWYRNLQNPQKEKEVIESYQRGLETIRKQKSDSANPLDPSWGEPELLMNLAWSNLHRNTPDLKAAQTYAQAALSLVPYWHYVRDILMPQIQNAIDVAEIQKLRERDVAASKAGDLETLKSLFTDDSVVMAPGSGFVRGKVERERILSQMHETTSTYEVLQYHEDFEELKIFGDDAVEWGTIRGEMKDKRTGEVSSSAYKVMRMLSKQPGGEWKISRSIYNDMPSPTL